MTWEEQKEIRDHAWKHFALHADQRLKAFHFYLILCTVVIGGLVTVVKESKPPAWASLLPFLLAMLSFVFWRLDVRTKQLIWYAEDALRYWEDQLNLPVSNNCPHVAKVFSREDHITNLKRKQGGMPWNRQPSYSRCFNFIFFLFGVIGFACGIVLLSLT